MVVMTLRQVKIFYFWSILFWNDSCIKDSISQHISTQASKSVVNFTSISVAGSREKFSKYKAHGCLMIIAWMLFASTGILFARYYKYLYPNIKLCGVQFWFLMHRPIMLLVPILSIISFLIILSQLDWFWVLSSIPVAFTHSIFGIIAIIFSIIQV